MSVFRVTRERSPFEFARESGYNYIGFLGQLVTRMNLITSRKVERSKAVSRREREKEAVTEEEREDRPPL